MINRVALLLALILPFQASAGVFGYYHTSAEDVAATWPHTNLVHVQAANPLTVSIDQAVELLARDRGIEVVGSLAFAYRYPQDFSILSGSDAQRAAWENLGADIISPSVITPPAVQEPVVAPRPVWRWWIDDWAMNLSWLIQNWWTR
jgi:hypothetical protein